MNKEELSSALKRQGPSSEFSTHEKALWLSHNDQWDKAHDLIQSEDDSISSLVHGYLYHIEGDHGNGDYWYRRSGYDAPKDRDEQWDYIVAQVAGK